MRSAGERSFRFRRPSPAGIGKPEVDELHDEPVGPLGVVGEEDGAEVEMRIKTRKVKVLIDKEKIALARLAIDFSS